ncbi:hypothetical protein PV11_07321 [Exophiala sideris]|uniref:Major facilitator superfamily (MFS) profile domain-containing protein n=1 Tax=Exophiala sideris TaxID=1016849 RepID=A0A0D1VUC8_9EURO|nr:hypothetical protein PV11_07321 [Exophiala sideris]
MDIQHANKDDMPRVYEEKGEHVEQNEMHAHDGEVGRRASINQYEVTARLHKINYWGKGYILLYLSCLLVYFNSTMKGYDGSLMASLNVLPEYQDYFNLGGAASATSIVFAVFQIGQIAASFFFWPMDIFGRKMVLFVCSLMVMVSIIIQGTAKDISVFIGARFLGAFFSTIASVTSVVYLVEVAPPLHRGAVAGTFNTLYYCGALIASFSSYGASLHHGGTNAAWKIPVYLQLMCPLIVAAFVFFVPESPRWLIMKGRREEAKNIIIKYHANGDASHPAVDVELHEIEESITPDHKEGTKPWVIALDFRKLFTTRSRRYRAFLAGFMGWAGEFSGANIASYYLPVMARKVGITDTTTLLLLTSMYFVVCWIFAIAGANLHDKFGRRKLLSISMFCLSIIFAVMAAMTATYEKTGSKASSYTMLTFIFLFGIVFSFAWTPMQPVYPAEVLENQMRARGIAFFGFNAGLAGFINTIAGQVALDNISYNFYTFYAILDFLLFIVIYFFFVETKKRTMEELESVFAAKNPRKASKTMTVVS